MVIMGSCAFFLKAGAQSFFKPAVDQEFGIHTGYADFPNIHPWQFRFLDADGDGDQDLFFTGMDSLLTLVFVDDSISVWFQENTGSPQEAQYAPPVLAGTIPAEYLQGSWRPAGLADFDNDGDLDLFSWKTGAFTSEPGKIYIMENLSGQATAFSMAAPALRDFPTGPVLLGDDDVSPVFKPVDYNRDGLTDLLLWGQVAEDIPGTTTSFWLLPNNGSADVFPFDTLIFNPTGLSAIAAQYQENSSPGALDSTIYDFNILDFDGDGVLDLFVHHEPLNFGFHWYRGTAVDSLRFQASPAFPIRLPEYEPLPDPNTYFMLQPAFADLDGDGDVDGISSGLIMERVGTFGLRYIDWFSFFLENLQAQSSYVYGKAFIDVNGDSTFTAGDAPVVGRSVVAHPSGVVAVTDAEGDYAMYVPDGEQTVAMDPPSAWKTIPDSYTINATGGPQSIQADFAWQFNGTGRDLRVEAVPAFVRPGFETTYRIRLINEGSQVESGVLSVALDEALSYDSSIPAATSVSGNLISWNFADLLPLEIREARLTALVAPATPLGDTLHSLFQVVPLDGDLAPENNAVLMEQIVTGSYDPNDKLVQPLGSGPEGYVPEGTGLFTYTIRFQNTGTDTAFRVVITDTLDADLDVTTFELTAWSHAYTLTVDSQRVARWVFDDILLPDSTTDQAGSQGFVQYEIMPVDSKPPGTRFTNRAHIYFDFNEPIATNTTVNTIAVPLGISNLQSLEFRLYPNPAHETARLEFGNPAGARAVLEVFSLAGHRLAYRETHGNAFEWKRGELPAGTYLFRLRVGDRTGAGKLIVAGR